MNLYQSGLFFKTLTNITDLSILKFKSLYINHAMASTFSPDLTPCDFFVGLCESNGLVPLFPSNLFPLRDRIID